jgi:hypothetical protein
MASPTIPTSFVPRQQFAAPPPRPKRSGENIFLIASIGIFALALLAAGGTFAYEKYLESSRDAKEASIASKQQGIDSSTVAEFVALSNRLSAAQTILDNHVAVSQFFDLLEGLTLQSVSITALTLHVADDRTATLSIAGNAKTFNALASESAAFAQQPLIKHAIFSGLNAGKDGTVSFTVTADLDSSLIKQKPPAAPPAAASAATASSTATTTAPASPATTTPPAASSTPAAPPAPPEAPAGSTTPSL